MDALGVASATMACLPEQDREVVRLPELVQAILDKASWQGMRMQLSMMDMWPTNLPPRPDYGLAPAGLHVPAVEWWVWATQKKLPEDLPGWWNNPTAGVVSNDATSRILSSDSRRLGA